MHLAIILAALLCEASGDTTRRPPAVLPAAFAAGYPSGAFIRLEAAVNASGQFLRANYDIGPTPLRQTALAWAKRVTYVPPRKNCKNVGGDVTVDLQFYPPSSGVAGLPPVVQTIDFGELAYARGPCPDSARAVLHQNAYAYFSKQAGTDMTVSVENVFSGVVGGARIAVVVIRCDVPGAFTADALAYRVDGKRAVFLAKLGSSGVPASDEPFPDLGWIHVSFSKSMMYVDTWNGCGNKYEWQNATYVVRGAKLVTAYRAQHRRASVADVCGAT